MSALPDGDPLAGHVDVEHVAVGGHSLGAVTTIGAAYNTCCIDDRIDATIPIAGGPLGFEGGDWEHMPPTPMLLAHGEADGTVPIAASDALFEMASPPVWYLRTTTADHASVLLDAHGELLVDAIEAFLDAQLKGEPEALDAMGDVVEQSGLGEWRTKPDGG
jgi:dienelactone hydrolase